MNSPLLRTAVTLLLAALLLGCESTDDRDILAERAVHAYMVWLGSRFPSPNSAINEHYHLADSKRQHMLDLANSLDQLLQSAKRPKDDPTVLDIRQMRELAMIRAGIIQAIIDARVENVGVAIAESSAVNRAIGDRVRLMADRERIPLDDRSNRGRIDVVGEQDRSDGGSVEDFRKLLD